MLTVMPLLPFVEDRGISKDEALGRVVERKDNCKKINKVTRASVERKKMYEPKLGTGSLL